MPFALAALAAALAVALAGIGSPAYWVDEAATVMLVHWPWADLASAVLGPEAPLGPYYLLMKPWASLNGAEWWIRLPSAVPMAVSVAVLATWLRRRLSTASALVAVATTLALPAFTRYAQEARPYGLMVLAVTLCALAWWRWCERGGRAAATWYAVSVAAVSLFHVLALTLVAAQALAALLGAAPRRAPDRAADGVPERAAEPSRWRRAVVTAGLAGLGLLPLLPYLWLVRQQATGVAHPLPLTWSNAWTTFASSLAGPSRTGLLTTRLGAGVAALAGLGLLGGLASGDTASGDTARRRVVAFLGCWAVVPPLLLSVAAISEETLVARYFLVSLPAWGALAGQGCVVIGGAVLSSLTVSGSPVRAVRGLAAVGGLLPLLALVPAGLPHQAHYRTPGGHDNGDIRPALALLNSSGYRSLPVVMLHQQFWWVILAAAYDPALPRRSPLVVGPTLGPDRHIVLHEVDAATAAQRLAGLRAVTLLVHTGDREAAVRSAEAASTGLTQFDIASVSTYGEWSVVLMFHATGA